MNFISRLTVMAAALAIMLPLAAIELPVTTIGGTECYYYTVKPKETVFTICRELGITRSELVKFNPAVSDGLRVGQTLYFPVDQLPAVERQTQSGKTAVPAQAPVVPPNPVAPMPKAAKARTHLVEKGETIYGITNRYGITEEQLFEYNPSVAQNGLKQGTILTLPDEDDNTTAEAAQDTVELQPVKNAAQTEPDDAVANTDVIPEAPSYSRYDRTAVSPDVAVQPAVVTMVEEEDMPAEATEEIDSLRIAIMLPFMLDDENPSKQAQLYTEFYRGFLMAADSLRNQGLPLHISAHDTYGSGDSLSLILQNDNVRKADVIIAPDDEAQLDELARFGAENHINVMNIFAVRNSAYTTNDAVLQANIPSAMMYSRAVGELLTAFADYEPVFLIPDDGKADKMEFVNTMRDALTADGKSFVNITYEGMLDAKELSPLEPSKRYVFIPASGSQVEFNKIIPALKQYKEKLDDYSFVQLFGYPEWITFRKESVDNMHFMNATIYSRFYNNAESDRSRDFNTLYHQWFGTKPMNAIPVQGILGFDSGMYIIRALNDNVRHDADFELRYDGIQNDYHFISPENMAGKINDSLYFINFRPSGIIDRRAI